MMRHNDRWNVIKCNVMDIWKKERKQKHTIYWRCFGCWLRESRHYNALCGSVHFFFFFCQVLHWNFPGSLEHFTLASIVTVYVCVLGELFSEFRCSHTQIPRNTKWEMVIMAKGFTEHFLNLRRLLPPFLHFSMSGNVFEK